jgi:tetratricopeptide (TPR) repeat protein
MRIRIMGGLLVCIALLNNASGKEEKWIEVSSPRFAVITDGSKKQARQIVEQFEQFRIVCKTLMPAMQVDPGSLLVIFAVKDNEAMKSLTPDQYQKGRTEQPAGIFVAGAERNFVALRRDIPGDERYYTLYHEYVHLIMKLNIPGLPLWLDEGLANFFGQALIGTKESTVGRPSDLMLQTLKNSRTIPLETLFAIDRLSPYYHEQSKMEVFYAEAWALTHYLMVGDKAAHAQQLAKYLELLQNDVPEETAALQAFGNLKELKNKLDSYLNLTLFYAKKVPMPAQTEQKTFTLRELSRPDLLAARGIFLVYSQRLPDAQAALEEALRLDPRNAAANEGLGHLCLRQNNLEGAAKYFAAAAELDSKNYVANYFAARLSYSSNKGAGRTQAESYLRRAIEINPQAAPAYSLLAQVISESNPKNLETLTLALKAAKLEPGVIEHKLNVVHVLINLGRIDEAAALAEKVKSYAKSEDDRSLADSALSSIKRYQDQLLEAQRRSEEEAARLKEWQNLRQRAEEESAKARKESETRVAEKATTEPSVKPTTPEITPPKTSAKRTMGINGTVISVSCTAPAIMELVLNAGGKSHKFRASNFYRVQFWALGTNESKNFQPCSELQGRAVQLEYSPAAGKDYKGEITAISVKH